MEAAIQGSASGVQSLALGKSLESIDHELGKMSIYGKELERGSSAILERGGNIVWKPGMGR